MHLISVNYTLIWQLDFMPNIQFTVCGKCFNVLTNKQKRKTVNGGSIGYWIGSKFYTLNKLRPHIRKIEKNYSPF